LLKGLDIEVRVGEDGAAEELDPSSSVADDEDVAIPRLPK